MDPYSDRPLVYRGTDDGFLLYSVGENFADDGGVPGRDRNGGPDPWRYQDNGDTVFWPIREAAGEAGRAVVPESLSPGALGKP